MNRAEYIRNELNKCGIGLTGEQSRQFADYYELLIDWNTRINLTAVTEFQDAVTKHFVDSLAVFFSQENVSRETFSCDRRTGELKPCSTLEGIVSRETETMESDENVSRETLSLGSRLNVSRETPDPGLKLIDVGTGAGMPGIPLKIADPGIKLTLLDSLNKRLNFLAEVSGKLGLTDVEPVHARAEDGARDPALREAFDIAVARAVASLPVLAELCMGFVRPGGLFIAYKSGDCEEEVKEALTAVRLCGGEIAGIEKFSLPGTDNRRSLIFIKKLKNMPGKYPRKAGTPAKSPLTGRSGS